MFCFAFVVVNPLTRFWHIYMFDRRFANDSRFSLLLLMLLYTYSVYYLYHYHAQQLVSLCRCNECDNIVFQFKAINPWLSTTLPFHRRKLDEIRLQISMIFQLIYHRRLRLFGLNVDQLNITVFSGASLNDPAMHHLVCVYVNISAESSLRSSLSKESINCNLMNCANQLKTLIYRWVR